MPKLISTPIKIRVNSLSYNDIAYDPDSPVLLFPDRHPELVSGSTTIIPF